MPTMTIRAYGDSVTLLAFVQEAVATLAGSRVYPNIRRRLELL